MKKNIRRRMINKRKNLDEKNWIEGSYIIQRKILDSIFYKQAGSLLIYYPFDKEVKTDVVIKDALSKGKIVCIPFNDIKNKTFFPSLITSLQEVDINRKIPQPAVMHPYPASRIDLIIVPGVAFDKEGNRIGMGGGFFDNFLKQIKKGAIKIAVAFDFQVLDEKLPCERWDEKVNAIITEQRTIFCGD